MRLLSRIVAVVSVLALSGCSAGPIVSGSALTSVGLAGPGTISGSARAQRPFVNVFGDLAVQNDSEFTVTFHDAQLTEPSGLTAVGFRVLVAKENDYEIPGATCTRSLATMRAVLHPVNGYRLEPGRIAWLLVGVRPTGKAAAEAAGTLLRYEIEGVPFEQTFPNRIQLTDKIRQSPCTNY